MTGLFILVSGLPASGKTTLARSLADATGLPLIDKDDILEALLEAEGIGDAAHRQRLSRASDSVMAKRATERDGAVLSSFWRHPGSSRQASGTPTDWLHGLTGELVEVHCRCPAAIALARFRARTRHPGHLDAARDPSELAIQFAEAARLGPLGIGRLIEVETTAPVDAADLAARIVS